VHARTALIALIVPAILFMTAPCVSADSSAPSTPSGVGLATANAVIVPPAWAGVWDVYEQFDTQCGVYSPRSYRDTLCTGDMILVADRTGIARNTLFAPAYPTPPDACPAPVFTDTQLNFECIYQGAPCYAGGSSNFPTYDRITYGLLWTLRGDVATTTVMYSDIVPPGCGPSHCIQSTGTRTRVAPESSVCGAVPARPITWGHLKLLYR